MKNSLVRHAHTSGIACALNALAAQLGDLALSHVSNRTQRMLIERLTHPTPPTSEQAKRLLTRGNFDGKPIDRKASASIVTAVNLRRITTRLARLNLSKAAREATALKAEFRREDEALYRQGRGNEVLADRKKLLGGTVDSRAEVLTINGVRIKP